MSNLRPLTGPANPRVPTPPRGESIARYETYLEAQRAVDYLSDRQFPVQSVTIVGTGLRMVERVTGRLTYPRVAGASALSGLYFGFFVGLALILFGGGEEFSIFAVALVGAGFGMLFGIISYALTGGRRDFTSTSQIVASEYEVLCLAEQAAAARDLLHQLPGGTGRTDAGRPSAAAGVGWSGGAAAGPQYPEAGGGQLGGSPGANPYAVQPPSQFPSAAPSPYGPPPTGPAQPGAGPTGEEPVPPPVTGPTYGEMIERQRREQRAREAAEREAAAREAEAREAEARETTEREAAARKAEAREAEAREAEAREAEAREAEAREQELPDRGPGPGRPDGSGA